MKRLKSKIFAALLFQLLLIIFLAVTGTASIYFLSEDSKTIIKNNYASVQYSTEMSSSLNKIHAVILSPAAPGSDSLKAALTSHLSTFGRYLELQSDNITEEGEQMLVDSLTLLFSRLRSAANTDSLYASAAFTSGGRSLIFSTAQLLKEIHDLNMNAILQKSARAGQTADDVFKYMSAAAVISLLINILTLIYFPGYISGPISRITGKIKNTGTASNDEISTLAAAFHSYEERDAAKTDLLATISHELKTPLSSINLTVKLLEDDRVGGLNPEQSQLIQSLKLHSSRILNLINEILDYTQAQSGNIRLTFAPADVSDIIELGTFAVLMLVNEKEIDLKIEIPQNLPKVKCDLQKTAWILVNLLNNAVRYSPPKGTIILSAALSGGYIKISVTDNGPGIPPEEQSRIFQKYVKAGSQPAKSTGLGLAIAKEFVEVQGGGISLNSAPGKGCTFSFTLPVTSKINI